MAGRSKLYQHERFAELLPQLAYCPENSVFYLDDQTLAFGFICQPMPGVEDRSRDRINIMLNDDFPPDTLMSLSLIGNQNILTQLAAMRAMRQSQTDDLLRKAVRERSAFLEQGSNTPIEPRTRLRVRDIQLVITVKIPIGHKEPTEAEFNRVAQLQVSVKSSLSTIGVHPIVIDQDEYTTLMSSLLNHGANASWTQTGNVKADDDKLLREQVFDWDNQLEVRRDGLLLGDTRVRVLSVKKFPQKILFGQASSYIGDLWQGIRGIKEPFILNAVVHYPNAQNAKERLGPKRQWTINQAHGPLLKFIPMLAAKKKDFDILFDAFEQGDRPVKIYLSLVLFTPTDEAATTAVSNAQTYWSELGFHLLPDRFFCLPLFLNSLPFGACRKAIRDLNRYKTMATRHVVGLLPFFGDWKGTGTPALQFVSRNGQLMNVSLFDSGTNYNCVIAAQSGSGKSFLTNELISAYLSMGGQVWVIDVGRSYEKLAEALAGDFIHFGKGTRVCTNPFELMQQIDGDQEDMEDQEDVIVGLIAAMAAPNEGLSDLQIQEVKRAFNDVWAVKGNQMNVDDLIDWFEKHGEEDDDRRIRDIGRQLFSFSTKGKYGRFINGKTTLQFNNRFTVLELEELKGRKHLQTVMLLQLIYQIQQEMYLGERNRPKLVIIDEAWDLLTHGDVAKFIEHGYRRFRKYGGSAITVTQSVMDLYASPTGRAIAENSANMYLLGQKNEAVNALRKDGKLPLSDGGYELLKTVHTVPGAYSEIFFITDYGAGIGRLIVEPFRRLLYSTKPEDVNAIKLKMMQGMSVREAIQEVMNERAGIQAHAA